MKYTIKRKDYHDFLKGCVEKVYKRDMTWEEYRNMEIEFEPIDFSPYPAITKETQKWIEKLFDSEDTDRNNFAIRS